MSGGVDLNYELEHRYTRDSGRVYLSGVQALVRLPLLQRAMDQRAGLNTAGFISGYRGSPLGTYDMALWQARQLLEESKIRFSPGVNEDLAATAVWGTQQVNLLEGARYDGVFRSGMARVLELIDLATHSSTATMLARRPLAACLH